MIPQPQRLAACGVAAAADIDPVSPPAERLARGRVVILECFQEIPCDPCTKTCPFGAILPMADINERPRIDYERCVGCAVCIAGCPGLAIFVVEEDFSQEESLVVIPYEFLPVPGFGDTVEGLDRAGNAVCPARVVAVQNAAFQDRTHLIWLAVPKGLAMTVRHLRMPDTGTAADPAAEVPAESVPAGAAAAARCEGNDGR